MATETFANSTGMIQHGCDTIEPANINNLQKFLTDGLDEHVVSIFKFKE
jgi:hypothetical protein